MKSVLEQELLNLGRSQNRLCHYLETRLRNAVTAMSSHAPPLRLHWASCRSEARSWRDQTQQECFRLLNEFHPNMESLKQIAAVLSSVTTLLQIAEITDQVEECGRQLSFIPDAVVPTALFPLTLEATQLLRSAFSASWYGRTSLTRELSADASSIRDRLNHLLREMYGVLRDRRAPTDALLPLHRVIHCLAGITDLAEDLLPGAIADANRVARGERRVTEADVFSASTPRFSIF